MHMKQFLLLAWLAGVLPGAVVKVDLVVYGATPAGIASAVAAARAGHSVRLIEPGAHVGGLLTGGLSYSDFRTQESVTGFFREYMNRVLAYYEKQYGKDSQQVRDCFLGAHSEPHVSALILREMMAEENLLTVSTGWWLLRMESRGRAITAAEFETAAGVERVEGRFWVDATYEGDLAAAAKVPFRLGRESTREYGERYAGVIYFDGGRILPGSTGEGDDSVQCANVRVIMTNDPERRLMVSRPADYRREEYVHLVPLFQSGQVKEVYSEDHSGILRLQRIPNNKADMNDIKQAPVRLALPGEMQDWPAGGGAVREKILNRHRDYAMGLLYFLQNDAAVTAAIRTKAREWGLAKDEFPESGHRPPVLYVREARRIEGRYTFTEQDTQMAAGSVRAPVQRDAIAMGDYSLNSHGHHKQGPLHPRLVEGDFGVTTVPFQIPLGVIQPKNLDNLLVPVAVSASHVGYSALRLEPTWTALGHAAGLAAHLYLRHGKVEIGKLQALLHDQGQATVYVSDVLPGNKHFQAVQWSGSMGLLSDVIEYETAVVEPLRKRHGLQYSFAFSLHEVEVEKALDSRLEAAWKKRLPCAAAVQAATRGDFLQAAFEACAK